MKWCKMGCVREMPWFPSINAQIAQYSSTHQISYNFELWYCFCANICEAALLWWKSNRNPKHAKLEMLLAAFEKYTISRSLVNRPTGQVVEGMLMLWLGFLETHKYFQRKLIRQLCKGFSIPNILKIFIGQTCLLPFSNANISLDLYLRFLSKNEYLGLNCMWWLSLLSDLG